MDQSNQGRPEIDGTEAPSTEGAPPQSGQSAHADTSGLSVELLREQLEAALAGSEENLRGWQRSQADFVNFRRRVDQERSDLIKLAESGLILDFLPVIDDIERALAGLPPELRGLTWVDGIMLIERKLQVILEGHGVKAIEALGKEFDPREHEAVMRDGDPDEATVVTGELQRGYRMHDRVIRPALVRVGPPPVGSTGSPNGQ